MSDEQTQPTGETAAFPERAIRQAFTSWDDQKTIQSQWSSWDEPRRAAFAKLVDESPAGDLTGKVARFLHGGTATPTPDQEGEGGTQPPVGTGTGGSSEQTPGGQQSDGDEALAKAISAALDTIESAEGYADEHPAQIEALLEAENGREKPRKTLVESLERAQRRRDREGKQGE